MADARLPRRRAGPSSHPRRPPASRCRHIRRPPAPAPTGQTRRAPEIRPNNRTRTACRRSSCPAEVYRPRRVNKGNTDLISGAGIAGPTLAYWLSRFGFIPTLIERARALRTGGYIMDFWGVGFDVAERMGLVPELRQVGYRVREIRIVNNEGSRIGGFCTDK